MKIDKEKQVLIISPHLNKLGGVSNFYTSLSKLLSENFTFLFRGQKENNKFKNVLYPLFYLITITKLIYFIYSKNIDTVVLNTSFSRVSLIRDSILSIFIQFFHKEYIIFHHGWDYNYSNNLNRIDNYFLKKLYKAKKILVLGNEFKEEVIRIGGHKDRIFLITTMVDKELLTNFRISERKFSSNKISLLFLSRIVKEKGIYELLVIFCKLKKKYPYLNLFFCGDGPELEQLKCEVEKVKAENVVLAGYVSGYSKVKYFEESDVLIFPSYHGEGLPISVLEAMSFGLPLVTTEVGGIKDFFEDGVMGFKITPKNINEVVEKIEKLINDTEVRKRMSLFNYNYAKDNFWSDIVADKFIKLCTENTNANK